jgi:hypothetical protein
VGTQQHSVPPFAEMQQHASGAQQSLQGPWNEEILAGLGAATASGIA